METTREGHDGDKVLGWRAIDTPSEGSERIGSVLGVNLSGDVD